MASLRAVHSVNSCTKTPFSACERLHSTVDISHGEVCMSSNIPLLKKQKSALYP
jgi:hypothetical protein